MTDPPRFVRRWVVHGMTVFDLAEDRQHLMVRPTPDDRFSILIDTAGVHMLLQTIDTHAACAVPGLHARQGTWLLGLRPNDPTWTTRPADTPPPPGPLELYVLLPDDEVHIVYRDEHLEALRNTLAEIHQSMI